MKTKLDEEQPQEFVDSSDDTHIVTLVNDDEVAGHRDADTATEDTMKISSH